MIPVLKCVWQDGERPDRKITKPLCSWSSKNWIAYTTGHSCEDLSHDVNTVYVMNPDTPWEQHPIRTEHKGIIEHLEWDHTGTVLLTVDQAGTGKIWCQDEFLINSWKCRTQVPIIFNEQGRISKIAWLDNCVKQYQLDYDKIGEKDYFQRYTRHTNEAFSVLNKENADVFVMVTFEGLVKLFFVMPNGNHSVHSARLGSLKSNILVADFIFNDSNKLFVATATDPCMVELFSVQFNKTSSGIDLNVEVWPCVVPYLAGEANFEEYVIEDVKCVRKCNPNLSSDQVLVRCKSQKASSVKVFEIKKEQVLLHSRFKSQNQQAQQADACSCVVTFQFPNTNVEHMITTKLQFAGGYANITDPSVLPKLVLLDSSGNVHVYSLLTYQALATAVTINELKQDPIETSVFSTGGHALCGVTKSGSPLVLVFTDSNAPEKVKIKNTVATLQSYLATFCNPWDLMLHLTVSDKHFVDQCSQYFSSEFNDLENGMHGLFYQGYCHFKALFFAISKDYKGEFESYNLSLLHNAYNYLTGTLQTEKEITLLEKLHNICAASKKEFELTKILSFLDTKDVVFPLLNNTVHRPLIQWLTDYMVHLVRLILSTSHHHHDWKSVFQYFDTNSLLLLRKICVLFYILQKLNLSLHPVYVTMVNSFEVLPQLFKMVSKLYASALGEVTACDGIFTDLPFISLPLMYVQYPTQHPRGSVLSQSTHTPKSTDFNYYDINLDVDDWSLIHDTAVSNPLTMGIQAVNTQERQMFDGVNLLPSSLVSGEKVKQCSRCGILTIYNWHQTRTVNETWASCWTESCVCGGSWKKVYEKKSQPTPSAFIS